MFGFKHTLNKFDHNEVNFIKSRLFGRVLNVNGPNQIVRLYPVLQKRLLSFLDGECEVLATPDSRRFSLLSFGTTNHTSLMLIWHLGTILVPLASTAKVLSSRLMGVLFFGEKLGLNCLSQCNDGGKIWYFPNIKSWPSRGSSAPSKPNYRLYGRFSVHSFFPNAVGLPVLYPGQHWLTNFIWLGWYITSWRGAKDA